MNSCVFVSVETGVFPIMYSLFIVPRYMLSLLVPLHQSCSEKISSFNSIFLEFQVDGHPCGDLLRSFLLDW